MSKAEELLDSLESGTYTLNSETEEHIIIGEDRSIMIPESLRDIANQYDHNVETVTFDCPRYWDGVDMSLLVVYINYQLPDGSEGCHMATNVVSDKENDKLMHFDWTISRNVTLLEGKVLFNVSIRDTDDLGRLVRCWNSDMCDQLTVAKGLECSNEVGKKYPDIIAHVSQEVSDFRRELDIIAGDVVGIDDEELYAMLDEQLGG